ncbi:energy transducer TonB [Azospirillum sp. TSA2s]|uniref:TonB family protein n=1 Tax=Azospirillum sp. TSA2s TaxID=709810 RepID=UPI0010AB0532|nr:TonB family protein [Azospirillum sp. TSA2s]QCG98364.1 energy transducer TonB [Azospirillum sp. TSA2s]
MRPPTMRRAGRHWARALSIALHVGVLALLAARYDPVPPAPAAVLIDLDLGQPDPEPPAEVTPPADPSPPEPAAEQEAEQQAPADPLPEQPSPQLPDPVPQPVAVAEPTPIEEVPPPPAAAPDVAATPLPAVKPRPPESVKRPAARPGPRPVASAAAPVANRPPVAQPQPQSQSAPPQSAPVRAAGPPPDYLARLQARLARYKTYPRAAQLAREEGTVLLRFVVARDGAVLSWRIERGSGFDSLDRQVEVMIERAAPLPPMPDDLPGDRLDVVLPVQFALR